MRHEPDISNYNTAKPIVIKQSDTVFTSGKNSLSKNKQGLWELYAEGDPLEIGLTTGALSDSLLKKQEEIFSPELKILFLQNFSKICFGIF